jgi:hypothetical protein
MSDHLLFFICQGALFGEIFTRRVFGKVHRVADRPRVSGSSEEVKYSRIEGLIEVSIAQLK